MGDVTRRTVLKAGLAGLFTLSGLEALAASTKVAVVLDDAGNDRADKRHIEQLKAAGVPITIAVLPYSPHEDEVLKTLADYKNADILLHQPMEFENMKGREGYIEYKEGKKLALYKREPYHSAWNTLEQNLNQINTLLHKYNPNKRVIGLNNHTGSAATTDEDLMRAVSFYCAKNNLIALDSDTPAPPKKSVFYETAKNYTRAFKRTCSWLDTVKNPQPYTVLNNALERGGLQVAIGHTKYQKTTDEYIKFATINSGVLTPLSKA